MAASSAPHAGKGSPRLVAVGTLLVVLGLAGLGVILATALVEGPRLERIALALGLAPAALLSVLAQLAVLIGCRMLYLAWRRGRDRGGAAR